MKQFLMIGMDTFGHILCSKLAKTKCEIMIADKDPAKLDDLLATVDSAKCGDCTSEEVLRSCGIPDLTCALSASAEIFRQACKFPHC